MKTFITESTYHERHLWVEPDNRGNIRIGVGGQGGAPAREFGITGPEAKLLAEFLFCNEVSQAALKAMQQARGATPSVPNAGN